MERADSIKPGRTGRDQARARRTNQRGEGRPESAAPLPDSGGLPPTTPSTPPGLPYSYARPPDVDAADSQSKNLMPAPVPTLPPLADAFVALLAAEQAFPSPIAAPVWPSAPQSLSPPAEITDEVVETDRQARARSAQQWRFAKRLTRRCRPSPNA